MPATATFTVPAVAIRGWDSFERRHYWYLRCDKVPHLTGYMLSDGHQRGDAMRAVKTLNKRRASMRLAQLDVTYRCRNEVERETTCRHGVN